MSIFAIDLGGSHVACAVVDGTGITSRIAAERTFQTDASSLEETLIAIEHALRECLEESGLPAKGMRGLAFGFPGIIDSACNEILSPLNKYSDVNSADLQAWSRDRFGLPLRIENDVRLALLGEVRAGAGQGAEDVVMITLGTGIGGAAMLGGNLLQSKAGQAGVLGGHLPVRMDGRRCACGAVGCAEAEASTSVLPRLCRDWPGFSASRLAEEPKLDFQTLFRVVAERDPVAGQILAYCLQVWSVLTVALIHAYGPELILFGGGVMAQGESLLTPIREYVRSHAWSTCRGLPRIEPARLGSRAALLGALALFPEEGAHVSLR